MNFYKIVQIVDGKKRSLYHEEMCPELHVEYNEDSWTEAKIGFLYGFVNDNFFTEWFGCTATTKQLELWRAICFDPHIICHTPSLVLGDLRYKSKVVEYWQNDEVSKVDNFHADHPSVYPNMPHVVLTKRMKLDAFLLRNY